MGTVVQGLYEEGDKQPYSVLCIHQLVRGVERLLNKDPDYP